MESLKNKILSKKATIGVIGLGHTGLALANEFGNAGFSIIGYDIDEKKIQMLLQKQSYLPFLPLPILFYLLGEKRFLPTTAAHNLKEADAIIISVPTPINKDQSPNLSFIEKAAKSLAPIIKKGQLIVLQSTSYPGTTEELLLPILEKDSKLKVGKDFFLAYVPEREDAGNPYAVLAQIPRLIAGVTEECTQLTKALYGQITLKMHLCSSPKIAEAAKAFENSYRLINIAFVDEMKIAFDKMGLNIWEVIEAASTKPFGFTPFYPGPGIGGECIPVDPLYLAWKARQYSGPTTMIDCAGAINQKVTAHVIERIKGILQKKMKGVRILVLGVAFKKDVSDIREAPALKIIELLLKEGVEVSYHDPFVPELRGMKSIALTEKALTEADCVVIVTDHSQYQWQWICEYSELILDTRNACKDVDQKLRKHVFL